MVAKRMLFYFIFSLIVTFSLKPQISRIDTIETMPVFKGDMGSFIKKEIRFPNSAINDSLEGIVFVNFVVEKDGKTTHHAIVRGIRHDLDEEALRVAKLIKFETAAMLNKEPVLLPNYLLGVHFTLPKYVYNKKEKHNHIQKNETLTPVMYYEENDSCFCKKYYNIHHNSHEVGFGIPEKNIDGKYYPLEVIIQNSKYFLLREISQVDSFDIVLQIVIDKKGKARCGILLRGNDNTYVKKVFELLKKEEYLPAEIRRKSVDWEYPFVLKISAHADL